MAYLHVNSSRSPAASLKVANGATCKGRERGREGGRGREECSCFLFLMHSRAGFINPLGSVETEEEQTEVLFHHLNTLVEMFNQFLWFQ